jgi:hypothetical protein
MTGKPINLNTVRKARKKAAAEKTAADNRVKFGLSKAQKKAATHAQSKLTKTVESHKREP